MTYHRVSAAAVGLLIILCLMALPKVVSAQAGGGSAGGGSSSGGGSGGGPGAGGAGGGSTAAGSGAQAPPVPAQTPQIDPNDPLAGWFEWKKELEERTGTRLGLSIDLTGQAVVAGPDELARAVARYDLSVHQRLWQGAEADLVVRGGWGDGPDVVLGNTVNTNQYAQTGSKLFVLHLWVQQKLLDDQLTIRGGKMDLGDWIDTNKFAFYQYVGYSFAHNGSIPLPGNPLAIMFTIEPKGSPVYASAGFANSAQSSYTAGLAELFDGRTALFAIGEIGVKTKFYGLDGTYRLIGWFDGRDLIPIAGGATDEDRAGVAVSFDQYLTQTFGVWARYGVSGQSEFTPSQYLAGGVQWKGLIPERPNDETAIGVVHNIFADERDAVIGNASDYETYIEAYYNYAATPWLNIQPMVQIISNPGGIDRSTEVVLGVHVGLRF